MPRPFQFRYGPAVVSVPAPAPIPPLWTTLTAGAATWFSGRPTLGMPRMQHLYPQTHASFGQPVTFAYRSVTEFAPVTATGDELITQSATTA